MKNQQTILTALPSTIFCGFDTNHIYTLANAKKEYWSQVQHEKDTQVMLSFESKMDKRQDTTKARHPILWDLSSFLNDRPTINFVFNQDEESSSCFAIETHSCKKTPDDTVGEFNGRFKTISITAGPFSHYKFTWPLKNNQYGSDQEISLQDYVIKSAEFNNSYNCNVHSIYCANLEKLVFNNVTSVNLLLNDMNAPKLKMLDLSKTKVVAFNADRDYLSFANLNFSGLGDLRNPKISIPELNELFKDLNPNCVVRLNPAGKIDSDKFFNFASNLSIADVFNVDPSQEVLELPLKEVILKMYKFKTNLVKKYLDMSEDIVETHLLKTESKEQKPQKQKL